MVKTLVSTPDPAEYRETYRGLIQKAANVLARSKTLTQRR